MEPRAHGSDRGSRGKKKGYHRRRGGGFGKVTKVVGGNAKKITVLHPITCLINLLHFLPLSIWIYAGLLESTKILVFARARFCVLVEY